MDSAPRGLLDQSSRDQIWILRCAQYEMTKLTPVFFSQVQIYKLLYFHWSDLYFAWVPFFPNWQFYLLLKDHPSFCLIVRQFYFFHTCPTILLFSALVWQFYFFHTCITILLFPHLSYNFTFSTLVWKFYFFFTIVQQFYFFHIRLDNSIFSTHVWQFFFFHTCLTILLFPHLSSCNKSSSHLLPAQPLLPCRCHLVHQINFGMTFQ